MIYNLTTQVWSLVGKEKSPKLRSGCDPQIIHRTRRHLRRVIAWRRERIRNLTTELHHQFAYWLVKNHNIILLPTFEVKNMVQKRDETGKWTRKIRKQTVVEFYGLSHYRFKQYLITKAKEWGSVVEIVDESYTSKTCGFCGHQREVGGIEVYKCTNPECGREIDRDVNGARNIFLKYCMENGLTI